MKKKIVITLTLIVLSSGLFVSYYSFGLFTSYNYVTAKWDIFKSHPLILQYGEALLTDKEAVKIAPKYGFNYDIVAGCIISTPRVNGIKSYNSVMEKYLENKLGTNWRQKFDFQVDSLFRIDRVDTIRKKILAIPNIKEMDHNLDSLSNGKTHLIVSVAPLKKEGSNVTVGSAINDRVNIILFYYYVDPYSLSVSSIHY